jgi:hypothetical protein
VTEDIPDVWAGFWESISTVCLAAWPEIHGPEHPILRVTQAERRPWRLLIEQKRLASPWVVVETMQIPQEPGQWGAANTVYRPRVAVHYVTQTEKFPGDVAGGVTEKLRRLENELIRQHYTGFQCLYDFAYDLSEENRANTTFLSLNVPLFAGALHFNCILGYVVPDLSG